MDDLLKAHTACDHLKAAGIETDATVIRIFNLPNNDRGKTDHQAVAVVKPTGTAEEQMTYLCADPALGSEVLFKLGCGAIAPLRDGTVGRAVASRLPFGGAPAVTVAVIAGIILQSKGALAQRLPVLQQGLRQMVLEAAELVAQEQMADATEYQKTIDAGAGASSPAALDHAMHAKQFSKEVTECLRLITTEPDKHYDLYFGGLNWKSGRAFCLTSNIGIPHGPSRNKIASQLMRDGFTATIVRVFSSATATGTVHHEAMALARSNIDRFMDTGVIPPIWVDRLQCTLADQPVRLMPPTPAAHAAVTPTTLRARFHTVPMSGQSSTYPYDQMDRHQKGTVNEVPGILDHEWDEAKAKGMMQRILEAAQHERISVHLTVQSDSRIIITPGPSPSPQRQQQPAEGVLTVL